MLWVNKNFAEFQFKTAFVGIRYSVSGNRASIREKKKKPWYWYRHSYYKHETVVAHVYIV